jgi:hypothetical protein
MKYLTFDVETTVAAGSPPSGSDARPVLRGIPDLVCAVFYEPGSPPCLLAAEDAANYLEQRMDDGGTVFVGHNLAFDWTALWKYRPRLLKKTFALYNADRVRDTLVRQQLLDVRAGLASDSDDGEDDGARIVMRKKGGQWYKSGLSLADLQFHHLGLDRRAEKKDPKSPRLRFHEVLGLPVSSYPAEFRDYALGDATGTWGVFEAQGPEVLPDEPNQVRSSLALKLIELRGMGVHEERTRALRERAEREFAVIRAKMTEAGFYRAGERDPESGRKWDEGSKNTKVVKDAVEAAYKRLGLPAPKTKTGAVSCDKDSLKNSGDPLLAELSGAGPLGSIVNTFLPVLEAGIQDRIHTRYNNMLATGRISSAKPNLNNIPRGGGVRECIVPTPGFVLASSDYDCAELRSHAQVCLWLFGQSSMAEFFQRNPRGDPHAELAAFEMRLSPEEALARKAAEEPAFMAIRQGQKAVNFGLPGGMGPDRLRDTAKRQYGVVMSREEAVRRRRGWMQRWPEMRRYLSFMSEYTERRPYIEQLAPPGHGKNRVRGINEREPYRWYSQCCNTLFQGLTADGAKRALWLVTEACCVDEASPLYGSAIVGFLYDELLVEIPEARGHEGAMELERLMVKGMSEWVRDVPVTAGPKLMDRWAKKAKALWSAEGRLVPWTPAAH